MLRSAIAEITVDCFRYHTWFCKSLFFLNPKWELRRAGFVAAFPDGCAPDGSLCLTVEVAVGVDVVDVGVDVVDVGVFVVSACSVVDVVVVNIQVERRLISNCFAL